ncbi:hypothetical protein ALC57_13184, partial [Trachymyrmex cornetzi]
SIHANVRNYMDRSIVTWLLLARSICQWRNQDRKKCKGRTGAEAKALSLYRVTITKCYVREYSRSALGYKVAFLMFTPMHLVSTNNPPIAHAIIIYDEMINVENNFWQNGCGN